MNLILARFSISSCSCSFVKNMSHLGKVSRDFAAINYAMQRGCKSREHFINVSCTTELYGDDEQETGKEKSH